MMMKVAPALLLLQISCSAHQPAKPKLESLDKFIARLEAYPKPPDSLIDQVEKLLQQQPCIKDLSRWNRQYAYALPSRQVDETHIWFKLRRSGKFGIVSGRQVDFPGATEGIDDTPVDMAWGSFNRRSGELLVKFCGANVPGAS